MQSSLLIPPESRGEYTRIYVVAGNVQHTLSKTSKLKPVTLFCVVLGVVLRNGNDAGYTATLTNCAALVLLCSVNEYKVRRVFK